MGINNQLGLYDVMPFGKHKGEQIGDLISDDPSYLTWCVEEQIVTFDEEATKWMEEVKII